MNSQIAISNPRAIRSADLGNRSIPSNQRHNRRARYSPLLARIFTTHYAPGIQRIEFDTTELAAAASDLRIRLPRRRREFDYRLRFRTPLPESVRETAANEFEWVLETPERGHYQLVQRSIHGVVPSYRRPEFVFDETPRLLLDYAQDEKQVLLTKVRQNRLIAQFFRVNAYSVQQRVRARIPGLGQIETDEVYVGVNHFGEQFAIPVQAKGGNDKIGSVQVAQDLALCRKSFPNLRPRPVAVQFVSDAGGETIVMFELTEYEGDIRVVNEKHYKLVPASQIGAEDLERYRQSATGE